MATYFVNDISSAETIVNNAIKIEVTQTLYDVMVSFVLNLGVGN
ncbi:glycoside hydrolase family protein [Aliivibrio fischeri]